MFCFFFYNYLTTCFSFLTWINSYNHSSKCVLVSLSLFEISLPFYFAGSSWSWLCCENSALCSIVLFPSLCICLFVCLLVFMQHLNTFLLLGFSLFCLLIYLSLSWILGYELLSLLPVTFKVTSSSESEQAWESIRRLIYRFYGTVAHYRGR